MGLLRRESYRFLLGHRRRGHPHKQVAAHRRAFFVLPPPLCLRSLPLRLSDSMRSLLFILLLSIVASVLCETSSDPLDSSGERDPVDVCVDRVENSSLSDDQRCTLAHTAPSCISAFGGLDRPVPINYFALLTCSLPIAPGESFGAAMTWLAVLALAGVALAAVLFALSTTAEDHFCPTLSHLPTTLSLSQSLAGVTLLAFGNGSADVFAAIAAVRAGKGDLALASITGAGLFVTGAVVGAIGTTARPDPTPTVDPEDSPALHVIALDASNTTRDAGWYLVTLLLISLVILVRGEVTLPLSLSLFFMYVLYVIVVLRGERKRKRERERVAAVERESEGEWSAETDEGGRRRHLPGGREREREAAGD